MDNRKNKTITKYFNFLKELQTLTINNGGFISFKPIITKYKVDKSISKILTNSKWVEKKDGRYMYMYNTIIKNDASILLNNLNEYKKSLKNSKSIEITPEQIINSDIYKSKELEFIKCKELYNNLKNKYIALKAKEFNNDRAINSLQTQLNKIKQSKIYKIYTWFHK